MGRPAKRVGHPYYELEGMEAIPIEQARFCERRIGGLLSFSESHRPLRELLANAYWFGLQDAVEMYAARGLEWLPKPPAERDIIHIQKVQPNE